MQGRPLIGRILHQTERVPVRIQPVSIAPFRTQDGEPAVVEGALSSDSVNAFYDKLSSNTSTNAGQIL
jgi:hypothetical protein